MIVFSSNQRSVNWSKRAAGEQADTSFVALLYDAMADSEHGKPMRLVIANKGQTDLVFLMAARSDECVGEAVVVSTFQYRWVCNQDLQLINDLLLQPRLKRLQVSNCVTRER